jgi:hypothetical protein
MIFSATYEISAFYEKGSLPISQEPPGASLQSQINPVHAYILF